MNIRGSAKVRFKGCANSTQGFYRCLYFGNVLNENPRGALPSSTHLLSGLQSLLGHEGKLPRDFLVQLLQLLFPSHCEKSENYLSCCVIIIVANLLLSAEILVNGTIFLPPDSGAFPDKIGVLHIHP